MLWTIEELSIYKQLVTTEAFQADPVGNFISISDKARRLYEIIGFVPEVSDLELLQNSLPKIRLLQLLREVGYNKSFFDWEVIDFEKYKFLLQSKPGLTIWEEEVQMAVSQGFVNLVSFIQELPDPSVSLHDDSLLDLKKDALELFADLEKYLEDNMPSNSFKLLKGLSGGNSVFGPLQAESGFLDLYQLSLEEKQYQIAKKQHDYNKFLSEKNGVPVSFLDEEQFVKVHGESPILMLNEALSIYDCNGYEFQASKIPDQIGVDFSSQNIHVQLFSKKKGYSTDISSLSSGERTLLALTFYVYKLKFRKRLAASVLLLDEIDSSLHPFMCQRLIDVLYNLFHLQMGLKVILCTHSPSTVAFAPCEDSLYVMKPEGSQRIIPSNKDAALKELTHGVPSFSVNYENRRQVFVESKYDVEYYESLYKLFKRRLRAEVSLNFIASGDAKKNKNGQPISNCSQVIEITKILREGGNRFIWGIIDWDLETHKPKVEHVKVLGWKKRYSIENFILDPLLMAILILIEKFREPSFFELQDEFKLHHLFALDESTLQVVIDNMITFLNYDQSIDVFPTVGYRTVSGKQLSLPKKFSEINGHDLEIRYLKVFPELNAIKRGKENELKNAVLKKVIQEYDGLAPQELLDILESVQEV